MGSYMSLSVIDHPYGFQQVIMGFYSSLCVLMNCNESLWVFMGPYAFLWVYMCPYWSIFFLWLLLCFYASVFVLKGFMDPNKSSYVFMYSNRS